MKHDLHRGSIHVARAEQVYPTIAPGSVELVISDGPYGMRKAAWDRFKDWQALRDWYEPHVEAWGRVCAPSATVYLWGTQRSVRELVPVMEAAGWTYGQTVTWDKGIAFFAGRIDTSACRTFYDVTETCDVWTRGPSEVDEWNTFGAAHPVRLYLEAARASAGLTLREVDEALGVSDMARHWFTWSQWVLPSESRYGQLRAIMPSLARPWHELRAEAAAVHAKHRERWESIRAPFEHPTGVGNVWTHPQVAGAERLRGPDGKALHPCQKPLTFYDRIIRASSRPGSLVLEPFGGTCRAAVACEAMPESEARRYVCVEPDEDGRGYVPAVLASMGVRVEGEREPRVGRQGGLFG